MFWVITRRWVPDHRLEPGQRAVRGVGLDTGERRPSRVVELMDDRGLALEGLRRGDVLDPVALPEPVGVAERRHPALRRDARSGEDDDLDHIPPW
jgi:hypothetical protein